MTNDGKVGLIRRMIWIGSFLLLSAGAIVLIIQLPGMIAFERLEEQLAAARNSGDYQTEGSTLEEMSHMSGDAAYWQQAGEVFYQTGDHQRALKDLEMAEESQSLTPEGYVMLGDLLLAEGKVTEAVEKWQISSVQGAGEGFQKLADFYRIKKDWVNLDLVLMDWMTAKPDEGTPFLLFGLLQTAKNKDNALESLKVAREKNPDQDQTLLRIENAFIAGSLSAYKGYQPLIVGRALGNSGYWDLAEVSFRLSIEHEPDYAEAWAFLSEALFQQGEDGETEIRKALELNPESTLAQALMAIRLRREGRAEEALSYLQLIALEEPNEITWRLEIASTLAEMGKINEALAEFQSAATMDASNAQVWKQLTRFCLQHNMEVRTIGLQAARQALNLAPKDVEALDLMGWTFYILEDRTSAERFLERAIEIDKTYDSAYLHLGQLYLGVGENQRAYINLELARKYSEEASENRLLADRLIERYFGDVETKP